MDQKISTLPLTPSVNSDDTFEKSLHNTTPSQRMTVAQLVTFLQTAFANLSINGGLIQLDSFGTGHFANGALLLQASGQVIFGGAGLNGSLSMADAANVSKLLLTGFDGSASFAAGATTISDLGLLDTKDLTINTSVIQLNNSGSASFANGAISLVADGSASFIAGNFIINTNANIVVGGSGQDGALQVQDNGGNQGVLLTALASSGSVSIAGIKVLGEQQPAIADATSTLDVVARVNDILAALRVHGLIAV